jgi:phosphatidylglycerophosphate synthase
VTRVLSQRIGAIAAYRASEAGLSPNQVTLASSALVLLASLLYVVLPAGVAPTVVILIALQLAYGLDCADGQLARARRMGSEFGGWLDLTMDAIFGTVLAFAILVWVVGRAPELIVPAAAALCILTAGRIVAVYSGKIASLMRASGAGAPEEQDQMSPLRFAAVLAMDTPMLYLGLSVLRDFPIALAVYSAGLGLLLGAASFRLGLRLRDS